MSRDMNSNFKFSHMSHQYLVLHNVPGENSGTTGMMGGKLVWLGARHELDDVAQKKNPKNASRKQNVLRKFGLITARTGEIRLFTLDDTSCENKVTF